jgi:multiple antibiotic resistance protein
MSIYSATLLLFLVMDPLGNIPAFLVVLRNVEAAKQQTIILRELLIALFALVLFLFAGQHLLQLLQISGPSLTVAGGIILFLIAVRMIFPGPAGLFGEQGERIEGEPFIFPLAIPFVAGPSSMATVMLIMSREPERWAEWLLALGMAWLASSVILYYSSRLSRWLGQRGLVAMQRLMGMLLTAVAAQMFMTGVGAFVASL